MNSDVAHLVIFLRVVSELHISYSGLIHDIMRKTKQNINIGKAVPECANLK